MKLSGIFFLIISQMTIDSSAQIIDNPSFEGTPQQNNPPPGWTPCDPQSTPDTEPGFWNVSKLPSDGNSYLTMITRGALGGNRNTTEDCEGHLTGALHTWTNYYYSIDLAKSDSWGFYPLGYSGWLSYANPVLLRIWCANTPCSRDELLSVIGPVENTDWKSYDLSLLPALKDCNYLILEAYYMDSNKYFGNILIDNLKFIGEKEFIIPNIFTPNNDGVNDAFEIQGLQPHSLLIIYNRWGNEIYKSEDYNNKWKAMDCPDGIYYYLFSSPLRNQNRRGFINIIR